MATYEQMIADRAASVAAADTLRANIAAEGREPNDAERGQVDALISRFDALSADIEREEQLDRMRQTLTQVQARRSAPNPVEHADPVAAPRATVPAQPRTALFRSFGEFASAVHAAAGGRTDPRLHALAPTNAAGDVITSTDGFPIPPDMRAELVRGLEQQDSIAARCRRLDTGSNEIKMPAYESLPGDAGALQAEWVGEAKSIVEQKTQAGEFRLPLHSLKVLVRVSEESLADAALLNSFLTTEVPRVMAWKLDNAIINGTGAGQPLGILRAPALIAAAKVSGQAADTFVFQNVVDMWVRMHYSTRANAVWVMSQDVEPQLLAMAFEVKNAGATVGGHSVYLPLGAVAERPYGTLFGRPVIFQDHMPKLGDVGDVLITDFSHYALAYRTPGVNIATSMHFKFDSEEMAFRFTMRVGGMPTVSRARPLPNNSSFTTSPFVTIADRA
jgi:HK97 family phage major capsid protein